MATCLNSWLNSLTLAEAVSLSKIMRQAGRMDSKVQINGGMAPLGLNCLATNSPRTGEWYMEWARCEIIRLASLDASHPRWQPTVVSKVGATPVSTKAAGSPVLMVQ